VRYPVRKEVWFVDLGLAPKPRPCVVISAAIGDIDRAVITVVPHTTTLRGTEYVAQVATFFLKPGAFDGQGIQNVPVTRAIRILGVLKDDQMQQVERVVCKWLALPCHD